MKQLILKMATVAVFAALPVGINAAEQTEGYVDFGKFTPPSSGQFVEVAVDKPLIALAARLAEKHEPEVAELLRGLKLVQVNVISLSEQNRDQITERIETIRARLTKEGWQRVVSVNNKTESVNVHLKTRGEEAIEGAAVTVIDPKGEAVLVNIVGNFQPEKLAEIGDRLGIGRLKKIAGSIRMD